MAIEIRELVIKTTVTEGVTAGKQKDGLSRQELEKLKAEIIESCIDRLQSKLTKDRER
ncbi:MAG: DUF5908 family protein [Sediminibacterium sp.]|nr:DUF5908 family protein [Sediminibacterium sp.]